MVLVELDNIIIQLLRLLVTVDELSLEVVIRETLINVEVVDEEELPKIMIMIMMKFIILNYNINNNINYYYYYYNNYY